MTIRLGLINITTSNKVMWNIIKNLFVPIWHSDGPIWYSDGTVDIQLIPITAIIMLIVLL